MGHEIMIDKFLTVDPRLLLVKIIRPSQLRYSTPHCKKLNVHCLNLHFCWKQVNVLAKILIKHPEILDSIPIAGLPSGNLALCCYGKPPVLATHPFLCHVPLPCEIANWFFFLVLQETP